MEMDNDSGQSSHKRKLHQVLPGGSLKGTSSRKLVKMTSMSSAAAGHTSYTTTTTTTTTTTSDNVASQLLLQEEDQQQQQCHHHKKLQSSSSFTQTGKSTFTAIVGTTYEIDQKCLPPEAPHDIQCIRAVLISEVTKLHITVSYPSAVSLKTFYSKVQKYDCMDHHVHNTPRKLTRYMMQMGIAEPLMGTKPELDVKFIMSQKVAERVLVRPISCTEYLHQAHLKGFWLTGPDSTQSSEANCKVDAMTSLNLLTKHAWGDGCKEEEDKMHLQKLKFASCVLQQESSAVKHQSSSKTVHKDGSIDAMAAAVKGEKLVSSQDPCANCADGPQVSGSTNFKQHGKGYTNEVKAWRSASSTSPNDPDANFQSGITTEDQMEMEKVQESSALVTVTAAAELLTQLTNTSPDAAAGGHITAAVTEEENATEVQPACKEASDDQPFIRWGFRKKVTFESRARNLDCTSCGMGMMNSNNTLHSPKDKTPEIARPTMEEPGSEHKAPDKYVPYNFSSQCSKSNWLTGAANPASPTELHSRRSSVGRANGMKRMLISHAANIAHTSVRVKQNRPPSHGTGTLKLPKDMQGRWSSERYKSAQLKLIGIMHARGTVPGKPILRPALREEARKHIGDTGLLDHLLKHMTDTVVSTGERFRRRHNAEGAMEYWLEDASLMELRKAAGVEDPSWLPPTGWKPGDTLPGRPWDFCWGMTACEAAEMKQLKQAVEKLKSEMRFLCGRFKAGSKRKLGAMAQSSVTVQKKPLSDNIDNLPSTGDGSKMDAALTEKMRTRTEMVNFKTELTSPVHAQQHDQQTKPESSGAITLERFHTLENQVQQLSEECKMQQLAGQSTAVNNVNNIELEEQLQDAHRAIETVQAQVNCIMKFLQFSTYPDVEARASLPLKPLDVSTEINPMPLICVGEGAQCGAIANPLSNKACHTPASSCVHGVGSVPVKHDMSLPKPTCKGLSSSTISSSNTSAPASVDDTNTARLQCLARVDSYCNPEVVSQPLQMLAASENTIKMDPVANMVSSSPAAPHFCTAATSQQNQCNPSEGRNTQCTSWRNRPTGFKVCRPPGSFIWPNMMSVSNSDVKNTGLNAAALVPQSVEDVVGNLPRMYGGSLPAMISSMGQLASTSGQSAGDSCVATSIPGKFSCMPQESAAAAGPPKLENLKHMTQTSASLCHLVQVQPRSMKRVTHIEPRANWSGLHNHAFMEKAMCAGEMSSPVAQTSFPINHPTRVPAAPADTGIGTLEGASPLRSLPFLSMAGESGIIQAMVLPGNHRTASVPYSTGPVQCPASLRSNAGPSISLSLSLSLCSPASTTDHVGKPVVSNLSP